jgi:hypothetical protein
MDPVRPSLLPKSSSAAANEQVLQGWEDFSSAIGADVPKLLPRVSTKSSIHSSRTKICFAEEAIADPPNDACGGSDPKRSKA